MTSQACGTAVGVIRFCNLLLEKAKIKYGDLMDCDDALDCERDKETDTLLSDMFQLIEESITNPASITTMETLDFDEDVDFEHQKDIDVEEEDTNTPNSQQISQEWETLELQNQTYSIDVMQNVVKFYDKCKKRKFEQTKKRYSFVESYSIIQRFRKYIENNGRKSDKLKQVEEFILQKFLDARASLACVSERDLTRWALGKARELQLDFKASSYWLHLFKKKCRIVSRKITKLTTQKEILDQDKIMESGNQFVEMTKVSCADVPTNCIWNFDQSSFNYNHSNLRTLSNKGERETRMIVNSMNAVTHSYSIMPLVSMDGTPASKLLICLQEKGGEFGPRVKASLKVPNNIYLTSSKSGKLDKQIMRNWIDTYVAEMQKGEKMVLLYDSWAGQTDPKLYANIPNLVGTYKIPPKTTQWKQPLDNYFFRQYKIVRRRICDRVLLDDISIDLEKRENVPVMHSLIYNQFQAPIFQPMLRYSWYKCGYVDQRAGYFMNANDILFEVENHECEIDNCDVESFIRCSHCRSYLCITHFLLSNHYHDVDF